MFENNSYGGRHLFRSIFQIFDFMVAFSVDITNMDDGSGNIEIQYFGMLPCNKNDKLQMKLNKHATFPHKLR